LLCPRWPYHVEPQHDGVSCVIHTRHFTPACVYEGGKTGRSTTGILSFFSHSP
jgi:hypothetical protein